MTAQVLHRVVPIVLACGALAVAACTPETAYIRSLKEITLVSYSRLYPAFAETTVVTPGARFPVGDGEYGARVISYFPDFQIDTLGNARSLSDRPVHPAVRLEVLQGRMRRYFAWAFMNQGPPHFRAKDDLAFNLVALSLTNGERVPAKEETP